MKLSLIERLVYWFYRKVLNGYARVFATGLFHLENRHEKLESDCKEVALQLAQACLRLDARIRALENPEAN